jgi:hypothetical protein
MQPVSDLQAIAIDWELARPLPPPRSAPSSGISFRKLPRTVVVEELVTIAGRPWVRCQARTIWSDAAFEAE